MGRKKVGERTTNSQLPASNGSLDNNAGTIKRRGNPRWEKGGPSPNPKGAPKRGLSWAELIKEIGDKTPVEAAEHAGEIGKRLAKYGGGKTLKELVVLRVFDAMLFDPQPGLVNAFMDRSDGKVKDVVEQSGTFTVVLSGSQWKPNDDSGQNSGNTTNRS